MVPKGWSVFRLEDIVIRTQLGTTERGMSEDPLTTLIPLIKMGNLGWGSVNFNKVEYIEQSLINDSFLLKKGDFLFNTRNTPDLVGKSAVWDEDYTATFDNNINRIVFNKKVYTNFIAYYLNTGKGKSAIQSLPAGSTSVAAIYWKDLKNIQLLLPSLGEQQKIVQILSTWDKAISVTEKLLANSQRQKKALMQQLITGNKRLLDENGVRFSREWKQVELGDVFEKVSNGLTYDANSLDGLPVTRIETISTGRVNFEKVGWAPDCDNTRRFKLNLGDILYSHINSLEHIGRVAYFNDDKPLYHGMNLLLLRTKMQNNSLFLFHLLNSQVGKKYAKTYAKSAVNQASISTTDIKTFKVFIPERLEQQKIASVLSAADAEISILEKKLACLKDEKKALMQQLLTGKRRVKVDEAVAV
ncbi:TPA: restriction endonuclease subunit S [Escherichia coli]|uniref:restriction endonuclease subunit S n=1 Tax=Escherichia coli TaxID=562 RepID=UPI0022829CD8|nr:restriction endonuclease subunit S [Escherichia coli]ELO4353891.1 restriction endonuclease subunit S [Escherichia coli]MDD8836728.1 restriction endonuclease subunit S [Escherichia coli]HEP0727985.1 restriction endonuclease subunit S [Escherichia coli]